MNTVLECRYLQIISNFKNFHSFCFIYREIVTEHIVSISFIHVFKLAVFSEVIVGLLDFCGI